MAFKMKYSKGGFPYQSPLKDDKKAFSKELKKLRVAEGTEEAWPDHLTKEDRERIKNSRNKKKEVDGANKESEKNDPTKSKSDYMKKRELTYDPSKHKL